MYFVDNYNLLTNLIESIFTSLYHSLAFLNILVDTSETFGIFMLVFIVLIHQFNIITFLYNNFNMDKKVVSNFKQTSLTNLYTGSTFLLLLSL